MDRNTIVFWTGQFLAFSIMIMIGLWAYTQGAAVFFTILLALLVSEYINNTKDEFIARLTGWYEDN